LHKRSDYAFTPYEEIIMSTTTTTPIAEPTTPTLAQSAHDADARLQKEQLALVATLLPKESAIAEAEALGRAGRLDPAKVTLLAQLARPLDNTTLSLPLTERAVHGILAELIAALDSEVYEHGGQLPYDEDKLGRLGGLGEAISALTNAKIRADMDWKHTRAPMPQGGQYDPHVWELLGLLIASEPVGVLERARGRYPAHQQVIDLLVPLARHLHAQRPAPAPQAPRVVKPSSVARLEALRGEFSDDPEGISFILDFLHVFDKSPQAVLDALSHNLETPDAAAAASPTPPTPATAATTPA